MASAGWELITVIASRKYVDVFHGFWEREKAKKEGGDE